MVVAGERKRLLTIIGGSFGGLVTLRRCGTGSRNLNKIGGTKTFGCDAGRPPDVLGLLISTTASRRRGALWTAGPVAVRGAAVRHAPQGHICAGSPF